MDFDPVAPGREQAVIGIEDDRLARPSPCSPPIVASRDRLGDLERLDRPAGQGHDLGVRRSVAPGIQRQQAAKPSAALRVGTTRTRRVRDLRVPGARPGSRSGC